MSAKAKAKANNAAAARFLHGRVTLCIGCFDSCDECRHARCKGLYCEGCTEEFERFECSQSCCSGCGFQNAKFYSYCGCNDVFSYREEDIDTYLLYKRYAVIITRFLKKSIKRFGLVVVAGHLQFYMKRSA